jgi:hypothetical protein
LTHIGFHYHGYLSHFPTDATGMRDEIIRDKERDGKSEKNGRFAAIEDAKRENEDHCRTLSRQHDLLLHTGL